jgi:bifunctional non-homologous end joining protein LigD
MSDREELPRFIAPMLLRSSPLPAAPDSRWVLEVKWDGIRCQLRFDGRRPCLRSRTGRECTAEFPDVDVIREQLRGRQVVLDGELVCLAADGKPDFAALRGRIGRRGAGVAIAAARTPVALVVFDVLHLDGRAVRELEYWRRRELLGELLVAGPGVLVPRHFVGEGRRCWRRRRIRALRVWWRSG